MLLGDNGSEFSNPAALELDGHGNQLSLIHILSKWERAEASPDTDNLILLSRIYGISMDELLSTEDEIPVSYMDMEEEKLPEKEIREEEGEILSPEKEPDEYVHIGLSGIHCKDKDSEVHVLSLIHI